MKSFYNGKRIPLIPSLLHEDKLIPDFQVKANLFNTFLSPQSTPLFNNSTLAETQLYSTNARMTPITFTKEIIIEILLSLKINKANGPHHQDM